MSNKILSNSISRNIIVFILCTSFLFLLASILLWQAQDLDNSIVIFHNFVYERPLLLKIFQLISRYGMGLIALLYAVYAFLSNNDQELVEMRPYFMFILFTFALASISGDLLKEVIRRARPAVALAGQIANNTNLKSTAYPSGHTTKSMALALPFLITAQIKKPRIRLLKIAVLVTAVLVSYSRIALQRHYLSDILGGIAVALIFITLGNWIVNRMYARQNVDEEKVALITRRMGVVFCLLTVLLVII